MNASSIGEKISELRKERGYTQQELADKIGVTNKAVSKWERGVNFPDMGIIDDLAEALGTTASELMEGSDENIGRHKYMLTIPLISEVIFVSMFFLIGTTTGECSDTIRMILFILQMTASIGLMAGMLTCKKYIWGNKRDYDTDNILLLDLITLKNFIRSENEEVEKNRNIWPMIISTAIFILLIISKDYYFMEGLDKLGYYLVVFLIALYFVQLMERYDIKGRKLLINVSAIVALTVIFIVLGIFIDPVLCVYF